MAATFCTGPVHASLGIGGGFAAGPTTVFYYGTTRTCPEITEEPSYFPVMNDLAGPNLPVDRGYAGSEHTITLQMTRWDGTADIALDTYPVPVAAVPGVNAGAGGDTPVARGSLVSRVAALQLCMLMSNSGGAGTPLASLGWRRYAQTMCIGPNRPIMGNKENIRIRIFKAQNVFNPAALTNPALALFRLFDEGFGAPPFFGVIA
jgi:hypothetical protein